MKTESYKNLDEVIKAALVKFPKAKKLALENFVYSARGGLTHENACNLRMDATMYKWNSDTVRGIEFALARKNFPDNA